MGKRNRTRHTDLARTEKPGARAELNLPLDEVRVEAEVGLARVMFSGKAGTRSRLQAALETVSLVAAGCGGAATMFAIGAPKWIAIGALPLVFGFHLCNRCLPSRKGCESCGHACSCGADPGDGDRQP